VVADIWSRRTHLSRLEVEKTPSELCDEFNKLNLRIVSNIEVMEMEEDFTLGYTERSSGRQDDRENKSQHQGREVAQNYGR
jgi:hypothetical protein